MLPRSLHGIFHRGPGAHDESPIRGLRQKELARHLVQCPLIVAPGLWVAMGHFFHARGSSMKVRIDPLVGTIEPNVRITHVAPGTEGRDLLLVHRMAFQVGAGGDGFQLVLIEVQLLEDVVEKFRPFIPPVAVELRIIRSHDQRRAIHVLRQMPHLASATVHEVLGVHRHLAEGIGGIVRLVRHALAGDAVVLESRIGAHAGNVLNIAQVLGIEVEADVPVKFTIVVIARITDLSRPHGTAGLRIARKTGGTGRRDDRRIDAKLGSRRTEQNAVSISEEKPEAIGGQVVFYTLIVSAFGKPNAVRGPTKMAPMSPHRLLDLSAHSRGVGAQ